MKRTPYLIPLVAVTVMIGGAGRSQAAATGDLWESTTQIAMEGMPAGMGMPPQTRQVCTAKQWTKPPVSNDRNCEFTDFQTTEAKSTWKMKCEGMSGEGEITRTGPDAYKGWMKMSMPQGAMTMNLSGRRLGDCDAGEAKKERDAQMARIEAQVAAGTKAAAEGMKTTCSAGAESLDLRMWRSYEQFCTNPQGGFTAATYKAQLCDKAKSYDGYKILADRGSDPGNSLSDIAQFCGLDQAALTKSACDQAMKTNDLILIARRCPKEAQAIAQKECAGRTYTSLAGTPYARFCVEYAKDAMAGDR